VVALLFVDTYMDVIISTLLKYIFNITLITLVLLVIFCAMNWIVMRKNFIDPIMLIRDSVGKFAKNNAQADASLTTIEPEVDAKKLLTNVKKNVEEFVGATSQFDFMRGKANFVRFCRL
jgi:sigma-B regulation protein RsbU (phosphoserine phosphatase)